VSSPTDALGEVRAAEGLDRRTGEGAYRRVTERVSRSREEQSHRLDADEGSEAAAVGATRAPSVRARPVGLQESRAGLLQSLAREPTVSRSVALLR
jgi:hypothetical protein